MAVIVVLAGGMVGFLSAMVALVLGSGLLGALALWAGAGFAACALAGAFALIPRTALQRAEA